MQAEPRTSGGSRRESLLRLPEVEAMVGLRRSSIYEAMKRGEFPAAVKLSRRAVAWPASAIEAWIAARVGGERAQ